MEAIKLQVFSMISDGEIDASCFCIRQRLQYALIAWSSMTGAAASP